MSSRERLTSTIKASKSTLKILINKDVFFNFALFFASRDSKLLKRYAKKLETIKANLIVR
jgi:glutathione peroxidase-family protein